MGETTVPSCIHCGAQNEDSTAHSCPSCGMPRQAGVPDGTGQAAATTGYGYVRVGSTILPQWLLWLVVALLAAGGVTAYVLVNSSDDSSSYASSYSSAGSSDGSDGSVPSPTPSPTDIGSSPPTYVDPPSPSYIDSPTPTPSETSPSPDDASEVVEEYYREINDENFSAAWDLGGRNIGGSSYSRWVAGFRTTKSIDLTAVNAGSPGQVRAVLHAVQSDGSVQVFQGTYTVSGGEIVSADISKY
ncbi:hypothetical protein [Streptomyces angustmyceticus]|uniref:hypothetical protein n=1 Tax=Streptomyces angustmyceticus TaxID=285578 RepID=UPI0021AF49E7|nr:hypothetical protein [Streptomyces angustmyceticus]